MNKVSVKEIILTIGASHYILPCKDYSASVRSQTAVSVTLNDGSQIETNTNNVILVTNRSELIDAILKSNSENFYKPEPTKYGKVKIKKITLND